MTNPIDYKGGDECGSCGERLDYDHDELAEVGMKLSEVGDVGMKDEPEIEYAVMHADCAINAMRTNANLELA
jgi:hypothetical protein